MRLVSTTIESTTHTVTPRITLNVPTDTAVGAINTEGFSELSEATVREFVILPAVVSSLP